MKYVVLLCVLQCGLEMVHAQSPRTSWPMINGDPSRSSFASINMDLPLHIADTLFIDYNQENGMALWDNKLFIADASASNRLVVTDVITGDFLWSFDVPGTTGSMQYVPAVSDGVVLIGGQQGDGLYALDALTGDSLWFLPVDGLYTRSPVIADGMVYLCVYDSLICANLHSGEINWSFIGNTYQISPTVDEQNVYFCGNNSIYALDKFTGDTAWVNGSMSVGNFLTLGVDDDYLYTGHQTTISALSKTTGEVDWSVELDAGQILVQFPGAFARTNDYLVAKYIETGQDKNQFLVLNKATGQEINRYTGAVMNYGAPTIVNDYLVEYYHRNLMLLDLVTGDVAFSMSDIPVNDHSSQVIAANDKIYIAGDGPDVIVLEGATTAVQDPLNHLVSFSVYPNPAQEDLNLSLNLTDGSEIYLEIFTTEGVLVNTRAFGKYPRGEHCLSLYMDSLEPGLYFLHLKSMEGYGVRKVIIQE